jgi:hypothetical protein
MLLVSTKHQYICSDIFLYGFLALISFLQKRRRRGLTRWGEWREREPFLFYTYDSLWTKFVLYKLTDLIETTSLPVQLLLFVAKPHKCSHTITSMISFYMLRNVTSVVSLCTT